MDFETIAVDFDGTLCENRFPDIGEPKPLVIEYIKRQAAAGAKIILHTCRENGTRPLLREAIAFCAAQGISLYAVNENPYNQFAEQYGTGTGRKVFADLYIDDKAANTVDIERLMLSAQTIPARIADLQKRLHGIGERRETEQRKMGGNAQNIKEVAKMLNARNVVVFDNAGLPSIMVKFSKCTNADLFPGGSQETHPAFIVDGEEADAIYVSKYPCTMINGKPYSLPHMKPATEINLDTAAAACFSKGEGWHLLTAPEYALTALESMKGNTPPRGNTWRGASHSNPEEKGDCYDGYRTLTGSGPVTWAHDHTPYGVYDLCGNVWEWIAGLRLMDGRVEIIENNNAANPIDTSRTSPLWKPVLEGGEPTRFIAEDGEVRLTSGGEDSEGWDGCAWKDLDVDIVPSELLKALALYPEDIKDNESFLYIDSEGERLPLRGGYWGNGASAGVFALYLSTLRSYFDTCVGFRAAFYCKADNCTTD